MKATTSKILVAALVGWLAGCGPTADGPSAPSPPPSVGLTGTGPFLVSDAVALPYPVPIAGHGGVATQVAFVSLAPGTLANADGIQIRPPRSNAAIPVTLLDGGLDPAAVPARAGDTLRLTVTSAGDSIAGYTFTVPARRPPGIVRTDPRPNQQDVVANTPIRIVLTEPVDPTTVGAETVSLDSDGVPVPGQFRLVTADHTIIEFVPDQVLAPGANYVLHGSRIRDLDGAELESDLMVPFSTASQPPIDATGQLAFVRDGQILLINLDGTGLTSLTHDGTNADPTWSPDGERLAFASNRDGAWRIYVMHADGSEVTRRTSGDDDLEPAWSPDGRWIAYSTRLGGSRGIAAFEVDGSGQRVIVDLPGWEDGPAWTPDGLELTFTSDFRAYDFLFDLYAVRVDGGGRREVLLGPFASTPMRFFFQSSWTPDGSRLAVVVCSYNWIDCTPDAQWRESSYVGVANADGSGLELLAEVGGLARPSWSPDGLMIAFAKWLCDGCYSPAKSTDCGCLPEIQVIRLADRRRQVIVTNGHSPAWRPGRR